MKENLELEVKSLKEQVQLLQSAVSAMQQESERKELSLAKLMRDKEKLYKDKEKLIKDKEILANSLRREKLSSTDLKNQLENERKYYFEVKESYTQEMSEARQLKRKLSKRSCHILVKKLEEELESCKSEVKQLKDALRETLEANYNLSIRFLRMKTTKSQFKNRLRKIQEDRTKIAVELESRIALLNKELHFVVNNEFKNCISPSNNRYLQIIKQNGNLLHENFCLQKEIERMGEQLNKMHNVLTKYKLNNKLKYYPTKCADVQDPINKTILNEKQSHFRITSKSTEQSLRPEITTSTSAYHNETKQPEYHNINICNQNKRNRSRIHFKENNERNSLTEQNNKKKYEEVCIKDTNKNKIKKVIEKDKEKTDEKFKELKKFTMGPYNKVFLKDQSTFSKFHIEKKADVISKTCDSDGLDLVQVSEIQSKTTVKTGDLSCGNPPEYRPSIFTTPFTINFFVSNRSFQTQSCPDILHK
ncbi:probable DNA repair protein RAD50 [Agrilus planipennis]|uniref:Probable DNA repair protein RAD50 n=1 Tax=Agrilus planipennis TaxID=224129 RepID=A0A1W4W4W2_AGRPL|nr:probable DNA repair protein RAD50 [Agrilus planipennis]